jgi:hypothetical protein
MFVNKGSLHGGKMGPSRSSIIREVELQFFGDSVGRPMRKLRSVNLENETVCSFGVYKAIWQPIFQSQRNAQFKHRVLLWNH